MLKIIRYPLAIFHFLLLANHSSFLFNDSKADKEDTHLAAGNVPNSSDLLNSSNDYFHTWNLQASGLSEKAFKYAIKGYSRLVKKNLVRKTNIISIIDFSKPSNQKR